MAEIYPQPQQDQPQTQKPVEKLQRIQAAKDAVQRQIIQDGRSDRSEQPAQARLRNTDKAERIAVRLDLINKNDPRALERLIGVRDIVSINFLARGLQVARSICRIKTLGLAVGPPDYATGFLITPNLLITNNHVLPDPEAASRSLAEFGYELDQNFVETRGRIFPLAPSEAFYTSAELDFTVVGILPMGHDGTPISDFGMLPLIAASGKALVDEHVSIIQHPQGGTKQVVLRENRVIELDKTRYPDPGDIFMHYTADTEPGSSGSPIFNDQWEVMAIHHEAIDDRDAEGRPLNKRGELWTKDQGDDARKWIANEGIRISAICRHLISAARFNADAARITAMLACEPRASQRVRISREETPLPEAWQTLPNVPDAPAFESTRFTDRAFRASLGYDPKFLGNDFPLSLPKPGPTFRGTLAINDSPTTPSGNTIFDYTHFSLAMHAERRLAAWTAVNIDGAKRIPPRGSQSWRAENRMHDRSQQTLAEVYGQVPGKPLQIDRGHLVRRLDPVWGDQAVADRAADDTFHYTNAAPQEHIFNDQTWGNLEDFVLKRAEDRDHKVTVLTGPILRPDDNFYGDSSMRGGPWQIPWSFWKIAIFRRPDDSFSVTGFILEQTTIRPIFEATHFSPYTVDQARVFQRPITMIEELTSLDFGTKLRTMDRMGSVESTSAAAARPIRGPQDIMF